jgi:ParB family chromosome partitioning protein
MKMKMELVDVASIKPDPNQPRKKFDKDAIDNLAKTIHGHKIINPIEIDENNVIITGEMRWRALVEAGTEKTLVKRITKIDEKVRFERQCIENFQHNALTEREETNAIIKLKEMFPNLTQEELANKIGRDQSFVSVAYRMPKIERKIGKKNIEILGKKKAVIIDSAVKNPIEQKKVVQKVVRERMSQPKVIEFVKEIKVMPKDVKDEILKPKSEITLEEAKEVAEFPKPEQRKEIMHHIKETKKASQRIIAKKKEIAKEKKPPIIKVIDIDNQFLDTWRRLISEVVIKIKTSYLAGYSEPTKQEAYKLVKTLTKYLINEFKEEVKIIDG